VNPLKQGLRLDTPYEHPWIL